MIVTHNMRQAARVLRQCAFFLAEQGAARGDRGGRSHHEDLRVPADQRTSDYVHGRFG